MKVLLEEIIGSLSIMCAFQSNTGGGAAISSGIAICIFLIVIAGWSSPEARQPHSLKVVSSNLTPATLPVVEIKYISQLRNVPCK